MRIALILATVLVVAACSRNPDPEVGATGETDNAMSDTTAMSDSSAMSDSTMMAGDSAKMGEMGMEGDSAEAMGDSSLVNQEGGAQPDQQTMESDSVMGDSTLVGQESDSRTPGDSSMMEGDSAMAAPEPSVEDATPTDSAQGQTP